MAKGVLGNDPFLRGAAPREEKAEEGPPERGPAAVSRRPAKPRAAGATALGSERPAPARPRSKGKNGARPSRLPASVSGKLNERIAPGEQLAKVDGQALPHPEAPEKAAVNDRPAISSPSPSPTTTPSRSPSTPTTTTTVELGGVEENRGRGLARLVRLLASTSFEKAAAAARGLGRALATGLGVGASVCLDDYGRDAELVRALEPWSAFLYQRYWRVRVQGVERVPTGSAILVANHSGALPFDGFILHLALDRERPELNQSRWLVEDQVFHAPFVGPLINRLGAVRACPENAVRLLEENRPVIVFPEGVQGMGKLFRERYQLKRFGRGGFAKLAVRHRAPIIPVAVVGAEESLPLLYKLPGKWLGAPYLPLTPLGPLPLPARWCVRFGEPIEVSQLPREAAENPAEIQGLTDRTRETIQEMLAAMLEERSSVF